jgi:hypothetical protein
MDWNFSDILHMPFMNNSTVNDTPTVKLSGDKVQKLKELVLCNLKEAYVNSKKKKFLTTKRNLQNDSILQLQYQKVQYQKLELIIISSH